MKDRLAGAKVGKGMRRLPLAVAIAAGLGCAGSIQAFPIDSTNPDVEMRWDNTVRYNIGWRAKGVGSVAQNFRFDDSEYKFPASGDTVTNRVDLLSEFDFTWQKQVGFRVSGTAWYDAAYRDTSVKRNPSFGAPFNTTSYSNNNNQYTNWTERYYKGPSGEFLDAFVFGRFQVGDMPLSVKLGQHTVYWGESLFTSGAINSVSFSQMPLDLGKAFATPGIDAKELFMPLNQISGQLTVSDTVNLAAQYFFDWDHFRFPEGGTYLGITDQLFSGTTNFTGIGNNLGQHEPKKHGDWGVSARWSPAWLDGTLGFYVRRFTDKHPSFFVTGNAAAASRYYQQYYAEDIDLYGISLSKQVGDASVGAELNYRHNMPLYAPTLANINQNGSAALMAAAYPNGAPTLIGNSYAARGNTLHAVLNGVIVLPAASLGSATLWNTASFAGELAYSRVLDVTANKDMFAGVGYGVCDNSRRATLVANSLYKDKGDGCATKDAMTLAMTFTPTWLQVFPSMDLSMPMSASIGLFGNSPVNSGGNEGNGSFSIGLGLDAYAKYRFDLKYIGYYGDLKHTLPYAQSGVLPGAALSANGLSTLLSDRDWFAFTFKTTF